MSLELWRRHKDLEQRVEKLEKPGAFSLSEVMNQLNALSEQVKELNNKYRMLNARVSRKSTDLDPR